MISAKEAIERAARTPHCSGPGLSCNYFVARVGELQDIPYFRDVMYPGKHPNEVGGRDAMRQANVIYDFLQKAVKSPGSGWKAVSASQAQELANEGKFVVGVAKSIVSDENGHIVLVVSEQMAKKAGAEVHHGPWVRDGQSPNESLRSSQRFGSHVGSPMWVVWTW